MLDVPAKAENGISVPYDGTMLKLLVVGLLASCSFSYMPIVVGKSQLHHSLLYWDIPFVLMLVLYSIMGLMVYGRPRGVAPTAVFLPLFGLTGWCLVSGLLWALQPDFFAASISQYITASVLVLAIPGSLNRHALSGYSLDAFLCISIVVSLIGFAQAILNPEIIFSSITSVLNRNRSHIGLYMICVMAVGLYRYVDHGGRWRLFSVVSAFMIILGSGSRAALFGTTPLLVAYFFKRLSPANFVRLAVSLFLLFWVMTYIVDQRQGGAVEGGGAGQREGSFEVAEGVDIDQSAGFRVLMWIASWETITSSPETFLTGLGFSNYRWEVGKKIDLFFYTTAAHNVFLQMWTEVGLLGLLLYVSVFAFLFIYAWRQRKRHPSMGMLAALCIGMLLTGLTQETFFPNEAQSNFPVLFILVCVLMIMDSAKRTTLRSSAP